MIRADTAAVLRVAREQIGTVEHPARSGKQKYGRWYGMDAAPWCAIFVSWVFWHAGTPLPAIRTKKGFAYVPDVQDWAQRNGCWKPRSHRPSPGDLIVYSFGGRRADHVGIVELALPDGRIQTIEGNTSGSNPRMGGMVDRMRRRSNIVGFVEVTDVRVSPGSKPEIKSPVEDDMPLTDAEINRIAELSAQKVWDRQVPAAGSDYQPAKLVLRDVFVHARQAKAAAEEANRHATLGYIVGTYAKNALGALARKAGVPLREDGSG